MGQSPKPSGYETVDEEEGGGSVGRRVARCRRGEGGSEGRQRSGRGGGGEMRRRGGRPKGRSKNRGKGERERGQGIAQAETRLPTSGAAESSGVASSSASCTRCSHLPRARRAALRSS